jgi:hypothetical protein
MSFMFVFIWNNQFCIWISCFVPVVTESGTVVLFCEALVFWAFSVLWAMSFKGSGRPPLSQGWKDGQWVFWLPLNLFFGGRDMYLYEPSFFPSQQDTIVALKALSEFAALMNTERTDIHVTVMEPHLLHPLTFQIDTHNRLLLQTAQVWTRSSSSKSCVDASLYCRTASLLSTDASKHL